MLTLLSLATLVASTSFGQFTINEDDLTLIRANIGNKSGPLSAWSYLNDGPGSSDFVGSLSASDLKIKGAKTGGKKPVRWTFPADWDGDGTDEFVVIRELTKKKDKRLELRVYPSPRSIFDSIDDILAKSKKSDFGVAKGEGMIVAVGAVDIDGDGQDEVMVIREHTWGARFLEIRNLPAGKKSQMGNPIASDVVFGGQAGLESIVSIWGSDLDGDGADEIMVLSRNAGGSDKLSAYAAPLTIFADVGAAIASFTDVTAPSGFENVAAGRLYLKENGPSNGEEFFVLAQNNPDTGDQRVAVHDRPLFVGAGLLPPVAVDVTPGFVDPQYPIISVFGTRDNPPPPPPPPPVINGTFSVTFDAQDLTGSQVSIGPFLGAVATVGQTGGVFEWNLTIQPGATVLVCPVNGEIVDGAIISIPPAVPPSPPLSYYTFNVTSNVSIATIGDTITWPGMDVQVDNQSPLLISGSDGNCDTTLATPTCGALFAPDGTTVKAWIVGLIFTKA